MNTIGVLYIKNMVIKRINMLLKDVKNSDELYRALCNYVIGLGEKFGYQGARRKLETYAMNKSGYIDVIWMNELGDIEWAISIDGGLRKRSIAKLQAVHTENKLWLYYGNSKKLRKFIEKNDPNGDIKVIHLGDFRKKIRNKSASKNILNKAF
ncbi:hypothetical protein [Bacillus cereus]|uniref:hypothetical protein n=1 Tax=Bacillus cereus TaxID=1396 RepID=UPI002B24A184|nr:hypothetical protein [Bacillus cereus]MEB2584698.1 hypothetical protein [Bacillus cereus]MEB2612177.1 hypothetical protein [Bacillus cereus]